MSMSISIYKSTKQEYTNVEEGFLDYCNLKSHKKLKKSIKTKRNVIDFYNIPIDIQYFPLKEKHYTQGWFMRAGWYNHKDTTYFATSLKSFDKYCKKYMKFMKNDKNNAIWAYRFIKEKYENGDIIEIAW